MPTTASGTPYTTTTVDLGAPHGIMHMTFADAMAGQPLRMWLYGHGAGGASDQMVSLPAWRPMRDALLDDTEHPWVIVEGSGGSTVGAQNWGNPASLNAYPAYDAHATSIHNIVGRIIVGRSMAGLITGHLYSNDTTGHYNGWINNSGVSTAFVGAKSGSKDVAAATGWYFSPTVWDSWGATSVATLETLMRANDAIPEEWPATRFTGKNILWVYGTTDTTVPWATRGGEAVRALWAGQPAIDRISVNSGGHSAPGSYADVPAMLTFITDVFGDTPPPVEPATIERITQLFIIEGGQRYTMAL